MISFLFVTRLNVMTESLSRSVPAVGLHTFLLDCSTAGRTFLYLLEPGADIPSSLVLAVAALPAVAIVVV